MELILERVKDELCGNYIVITNPSNELQKVSPEDLLEIFTHLLDHTFIYSNGCIYISIWLFYVSYLEMTVLTRTKKQTEYKEYSACFFVLVTTVISRYDT